MKSRILSLAVVAIAAYQTKAQVTEIRTVDAFHGLKIQSAIEVKYTPSATTEIKITAGDKYINDVKVVSVNGILELYYDGNKNFQNQDDIKADISGPANIDFIEMTGAASFKNSDTLRPDKFKYDFSGASSGSVTLVTPTINGEISGAASAKLFGKAGEARHQASGAGTLKAYELYTNKVKVSVSGASSARVRAIQEISGDASGAASLYFKGNPEKQDLETSGAGSVKKVVDDGSNAGNTDRNRVETTPSDTNKDNGTEINIGGSVIKIKNKKNNNSDDDEKKREKKEKNNKFADDNWSGFEFGIPGYLNNGNFQPSGKIGTRDMANLELNYGKSRHWAWNIADWNVKIIKHHLEFTTGLGLAWDNYAFRKPITLTDDSGFVSYNFDTAKSEGRNYSYNKLRVNSLQVPLLLSFNTSGNEDKTFRITAGAVLGWNYRTRIIQEYTTAKDNFEYERKSKTNFGVVNPFKVMLQGSVGYGKFNVFSTYNVTELFDTNNKNPKLLPITFGIRISI